MTAKVGDRLIVESEKVGTKPRVGEILEVSESSLGVRYSVRWEDGHESTFRPAAGSTRVESAVKTAPKAAVGTAPKTAVGPAPKGKPA